MLAVLIVFLVLYLPIILNIGVVYSSDFKKIYIGIYLFKYINIFGGYAEFLKEGICFHVSNQKAVIFPYKKMLELKNTIKPVRDFQIIKINSCIELGKEGDYVIPSSIGFVLNFINCLIGSLITKKKPYLNYKNSFNIFDKDIFNVYFEASVLFNILVLLIGLAKFILEKIIYVFRGQKQ